MTYVSIALLTARPHPAAHHSQLMACAAAPQRLVRQPGAWLVLLAPWPNGHLVPLLLPTTTPHPANLTLTAQRPATTTPVP